MSLMGYTEEDLESMLDATRTVLATVKEKDDAWLHGNLDRIANFLEGLLVEGRV